MAHNLLMIAVRHRTGVVRRWLLLLAAYALAFHPAAMATMSHGAAAAPGVAVEAQSAHAGHVAQGDGGRAHVQGQGDCGCCPTGCPIALAPDLPDATVAALVPVAPAMAVRTRPFTHIAVGFRARGPPVV